MSNSQNQIPIQQESQIKTNRKKRRIFGCLKKTNSILSRAFQIVMKGDVKSISLNSFKWKRIWNKNFRT